ncbi:MAG: AtpZ/AtpI family protein [Bacteroidota bacterium]
MPQSRDPKPNPKNDKPGRHDRMGLRSLREYSPYLTLGFQLAASVVVFLLLGVWLDAQWNTSPWLMLTGLVLGTTGGFIKFFTTVSKLERKDEVRARED